MTRSIARGAQADALFFQWATGARCSARAGADADVVFLGRGEVLGIEVFEYGTEWHAGLGKYLSRIAYAPLLGCFPMEEHHIFLANDGKSVESETVVRTRDVRMGAPDSRLFEMPDGISEVTAAEFNKHRLEASQGRGQRTNGIY
ncbi:MAG: hypothetical protein HY820_03420 [Acidobacteria bacterium]|nr:hypothetical protein [Acidobacteriota bacterium]